MRTVIDLPDEQVQALDALGADLSQSRAELVRRAVDLYLSEDKKRRSDAAVDSYHGFLSNVLDAFDGLDADAYMQKIRGEWDDRDQAYSTSGMQDSASSEFQHQKLTEKP